MFEFIRQNLIKEQERWFLFTPVLFGLGIGVYFSLNKEPSRFAVVLLVEALLVLLYVLRNKGLLFLLASSVFICLLGFADIKLQTEYKKQFVPTLESDITYIRGRIFKTDTTQRGKIRLWLKDASDFEKDLKGNYKITLNSKQDFTTGDCIEVAASLMKPPSPLRPNGYQFDRASFFETTSAVGFALSSAYLTDCSQPSSFYEKSLFFISHIRHQISQKIKKVLPPDEASVATALIAGDKSFMKDTLYSQYRNAGLAHFLSISGLHMGFIASIAFFVFRLLIVLLQVYVFNFSAKKAAAVFAIFFSFIYLLISGSTVPAERAFIMISLVFLGILFDRPAISMRTICFAALFLLVCFPYILIKPGFQMSFAAVVGLVAFYEKYGQKLGEIFLKKGIMGYIFAYFAGVLITTLVATLSTIPVVVYHFQTIAPYTLIGNLISGPIIGFIIMPFVFLSLFLMPFGLSSLPLHITGFGIMLLNKITAYISTFPSAELHIYAMPTWGYILIVLGGLWFMLWQRPWRRFGLVFVLTGLLSFAFAKTPDVLYSKDGKFIALKNKQGKMTMISQKKNTFLEEVWQISSFDQNDISTLKCNKEICTYQDVFEFDKKGLLRLDGQELNASADLGGEIYVQNGKYKLLTTRQTIGFRPWNN